MVALIGLGLAIERSGGHRVYQQTSGEGVLLPEVPVRVDPISKDKPLKHTSLVTLSIPTSEPIDPKTIQVTTPGMSLEDAQLHPIFDFRKSSNPKPRSVVVLLDNSLSMVIPNNGNPASDPEYKRIEAVKSLLYALPKNDRVFVSCFPCRQSVDNQRQDIHAKRPFELLTEGASPSDAAPALEKLRGEENGSTPLYRAISQCANVFAREDPSRQRVLVLLTDGMDTDQDPNGLDQAVADIHKSGCQVYAIGLGPGSDMHVLRQLSSFVQRAEDDESLSRTFRQIVLQMSKQLTQVDMDLVVGRTGKGIQSGESVEVNYRIGGKLYTSTGKTN